MTLWLGQLREELKALGDADLHRSLRSVTPCGRTVTVDGKPLINFAGNDYLALSTHPDLVDAAIAAIRAHGTGAGASRLVIGHQPIHEQVEERFAAFKHAEAALLLPTGSVANLAVVTALVGRGDLVCLDKLSHASLIDAARLSGATVRVYPHLRLDKLQRLLARHKQDADQTTDSTGRPPRRLILTDTVFSMDGDVADLPALCDLADFNDSMLVVDDAHGTGVLGKTGAGLCELQGVSHRVTATVSTASKALGGLGGIVTSRREVIDTLVNRARPFIYTTAIPPAQAAAIGAALDVVRDEPERRSRVLELARRLRSGLKRIDQCHNAQPIRQTVTPIVPVVVGSSADALKLSAHLGDCGYFVPAIRPPTVAPGAARVRISLRADLEDGDIDGLLEALADGIAKCAPPPVQDK